MEMPVGERQCEHGAAAVAADRSLADRLSAVRAFIRAVRVEARLPLGVGHLDREIPSTPQAGVLDGVMSRVGSRPAWDRAKLKRGASLLRYHRALAAASIGNGHRRRRWLPQR